MLRIVTGMSPEQVQNTMDGKTFICVGIGEMFRSAFAQYGVMMKIGMLLDNSIEKQHAGIDIGGQHRDICPLSILATLDLTKYKVLFTTKYYDELRQQVDTIIGEKKIDGYIYQDIIANETLLNRSLERQRQAYAKRFGRCDTPEAQELLRQKRTSLLKKKDFLIIPKLNVIVTEKCSLRCKDCRALTPLVKHPSDEPLELVKKEVDQILDAIDELVDIEPIGGEPFLYPDLPELLEFLCSKEKIDNVWLTTNGTVVPNAALTQALQHKKIFVEISNYGYIEPVGKLIQYLEKNQIQFSTYTDQVWFDVGGTEYRNRDLEALKKEYSNCYCQYLLKYVWNNRIWICPRAPRLSTLGIFESEHDYIDLEKETAESLRHKLPDFFYQEYAEACNYCSQGDIDLKLIPAGIQVGSETKPSNYTFIRNSDYARLIDFWNTYNGEF